MSELSRLSTLILCAFGLANTTFAQSPPDAPRPPKSSAASPALLDDSLVPTAVKNTAHALFVGSAVKFTQGPGALFGVIGRSVAGAPAIFYVTADGGQLVVAQVFDLSTKANLSVAAVEAYAPLIPVETSKVAAPEMVAKAQPFDADGKTQIELSAIKGAVFIETGKAESPLAYVFVEAQCVHCRRLWRDVRNDASMRIRWIPISFGDRSDVRAMYALGNGGKDGLDVMFSDDPLPDKAAGLITNAASRLAANNAIYEALRVDGTPAFAIPVSSTHANVRLGYQGKKRE